MQSDPPTTPQPSPIQLPWLDAFQIADKSVCYLDGNSLGRLPIAARERVTSVLNDGWGTDLIGGWNTDWISLPQRIGAKLSRCIGASPSETIVADSTSVNLFKLTLAALRRQAPRNKIVTTGTNFPSDLYVLESAGRASGGDVTLTVVGTPEQVVIPISEIADAIDSHTALVSLSHVDFRSGYLHDMQRITDLAHRAGALVLWDLSHSVGAVPLALNACNADLAVGCTYKYLCGGPGSPAFLYIREDLQAEMQNPIAGWFSHLRPFDFSSGYTPAESIDRFLTGTPPVLSLSAVEAGVELVNRVGLEALRFRSNHLTSMLITLFDSRLAQLGFELRTPRDPNQRGSHVSLSHPEARRITQCLIDRYRVIPDFRRPDNIRLGLAPLYTSDNEVKRCVEALERIVQHGEYSSVTMPDATVT